jgi:transposase-like protein
MESYIFLYYKIWEEIWEELAVFFDFLLEIRKIIYSANLIENLNDKIRKYIKNKLLFLTDKSIFNVFLVLRQVTKKD